MPKKTHNQVFLYCWLALHLALTVYLSFFGERHSVVTVCVYIFYIAIPFYWLRALFMDRRVFGIIFVFGVLFRLIYFFSLPYFSDDFYRFIWDGYIWHLGYSPYQFTPANLISMGDGVSLAHLFPFLNSQDFFSVYPPVYQYFFRLSTFFFGASIWGNLFFMRFVLLLSELFIFYLLLKLGTGKSSFKAIFQSIGKVHIGVLLFWLNGLIMVESVANVHIEVVVGLVLLLCIYVLNRGATGGGAYRGLFLGLLLSFGFLLKLKPLMYNMLIFKRQGVLKIFYGVIAFCFSVYCVLYFEDISLLYMAIKESSSLFVSNFEFNASIYFVISKLYIWLNGFNRIDVLGPWLFRVKIAIIFLFSIYCWYCDRGIVEGLVIILFLFLLLSTTVHPWYIIPMVVLCPLTYYRFPFVWSVVIVLSYFGYGDVGYSHPFSLILLEYVIVFVVFCYDVYNVGVERRGKSVCLP